MLNLTSENFEQQLGLNSGVPIQRLESDLYRRHQLQVDLVRLDLRHDQISGNKSYKLKYHLLAAQKAGAKQLLSFGGAFSNHLHALAYAARALAVPVTAIVRGEPYTNPTLDDCAKAGMAFEFVDRASYRMKTDPQWLAQLADKYPYSYIIPEGGAGFEGLLGVAELSAWLCGELPDLDYMVSSCGTGSTLAGLALGARNCKVIGVPVLKGNFMAAEIARLLEGQPQHAPWQLLEGGHYGGYARVGDELLQVMASIECQFDIPLDPVYTAKMWRRFDTWVAGGGVPKGSRIALLHTGGLQGRRGFNLPL